MQPRPAQLIEIVLEYVFDRERGVSSKIEENYEGACPGVRRSGCTCYIYSWVEIIIDANRPLGYSMYTIKIMEKNQD
jgi:hypothetical protein